MSVPLTLSARVRPHAARGWSPSQKDPDKLGSAWGVRPDWGALRWPLWGRIWGAGGVDTWKDTCPSGVGSRNTEVPSQTIKSAVTPPAALTIWKSTHNKTYCTQPHDQLDTNMYMHMCVTLKPNSTKLYLPLLHGRQSNLFHFPSFKMSVGVHWIVSMTLLLACYQQYGKHWSTPW